MPEQNLKKIVFITEMIGLLFFLFSTNAYAVPSFERQTGMECTTCHTVFPELTPFGRTFKLSGYVLSKSSKPYEFPPPLSGMAQLSFTHTDKAQPSGFVEDNWATHITSSGNNILNLPQELSIFYGGRIISKIGAFVQGTFDGIGNTFLLDMTDIRYADNTTLWGKNIIYGLTINNSPTVQDIWNSTPVWGFPSAKSDFAPGPSAGTIIDGALDQQVGGIGAYVFWNNLIYGEITAYHTAKNGIAKPLGAGTKTEMVVDDIAPYWRLALQHQWKEHSLSAGIYGMTANIFPEGNNSGPSDKFADIAFDAQYQYIGKKHILSAQSSWIHEKQDWDASFTRGNTANHSNSLNTFKMNLNYYYRGHFGFIGSHSDSMDMSNSGAIGGSIGYFSTTGDKDALLYSSEQVNGSRTGSPNSNGFIMEIDYMPWHKAKLTFQYIIYDKFNGAHSNYDGFGRDASDNNTLYFLVWLMF
ncbi:MAG: hypothetical protein A2Y66_05375 [Nitrospirae bacterium RBG_13_41_22]|nr:MAG: hypothetical protein A2Y66_05375 [Nitrospirae bacterium RBG_13_41_22]